MSGLQQPWFAFMEGRRLLERGSLWSRRKLSFGLTEESGLDFKKAFKTTIQHFGVPKWTVERTRKPQVAFGQGRVVGGVGGELGRQRSAEAGTGAHSAQGFAIFIAVGDPGEAEGDSGGRVVARRKTHAQRPGRMSLFCQGNTIIF